MLLNWEKKISYYHLSFTSLIIRLSSRKLHVRALIDDINTKSNLKFEL